jgi:hypothetical protein
MSGVAKAATKADAAKAPAEPSKGKGGKPGKVARERSIIDDLITLMVCVGCTVWAVKIIVGLSSQSF